MAVLDKMDILLLVIITVIKIHFSNGARLINENCVPNEGDRTCFKLYGGSDDTDKFTREAAEQVCEDIEGSLVRITSTTIQVKLVELMQSVSGRGGTIHVWTSGKKSEDRNWFDMNGQRMNDSILPYFRRSPEMGNCAYISDMSAQPLNDLGCSSNMLRLLCQSVTDSCTPPDVSYDDKCYHMYYDRQKLDWNRARQYCKSEPGRDLAHENVIDSALYTTLEASDPDYQMQEVWIGYSARKYNWPGDNTDITGIFSKFRGGINGDECVYIDPNDEGKWDTKRCDDENSNFICEKHEDQDPPTVAPTPATIPPVTNAPVTNPPAPTAAPQPQPTIAATPTAPPTAQPTEQPTNTDKPTVNGTEERGIKNGSVLKQEHIIGIAVGGGVLILVVIIAVAVIVTRGKRKMESDDEDDDTPAYNSHIDSGSTTALNYGTSADLTNVYSETPGEDGGVSTRPPSDYAELDEDGGLVQGGPRGVPKGYKESPQGELYSLPNRIKAKKATDELGPVYENS